MVKISIKKEEKTIKPRQKQKQKQSRKVVVNIGGDVMKPKQRRAPRQTLQKIRLLINNQHQRRLIFRKHYQYNNNHNNHHLTN